MNTTLQSQIAPFVEECRQHLSTADSHSTTDSAPEVSATEKEILAEAGRALKAWQASPEGQAKLQAMKGMSLGEIQQELIALLQSQVFVPTLELINKPSFPILKHPIQSITAALKLEADFIFGFSGSIGVAISPTQLIQFIQDPKRGELAWQYFISGWLNEGVDASAFVGIEVGVSGCAPGDLGGFSSGYEISIPVFPDPDTGIGPGISAQVFRGTSEGSWGATVAIALGLALAGESTQSYTVLLRQGSLGIPPIYQPDAAHFLIINNVYCSNSNKNVDRIYFYFTPDNGTKYRYPTWDHRNMSEDDSDTYENNWNPGRSVKFNGQVLVELRSESEDGDEGLGNTIYFYLGDFEKNGVSEPGAEMTKLVHRDGDMENGWNEVDYYLTAQLVY